MNVPVSRMRTIASANSSPRLPSPSSAPCSAAVVAQALQALGQFADDQHQLGAEDVGTQSHGSHLELVTAVGVRLQWQVGRGRQSW